MGLFDGTKKKLAAKMNYNEGNEFFRQGMLEKAYVAYSTAIKLDPTMAAAYNNLGVICRAVGNEEEAIKRFRNCLDVDPKYANAYVNLGSAYTALGRPEDAIREFKTARKLNPDYADTHYYLAVILSAQGMIQDAIDSYAAFVRLAPSKSDPQVREAEIQIARLKLTMANPAPRVANTPPQTFTGQEWYTLEQGSIPCLDREQTAIFKEIEYGKPIPFDEEEQLYVNSRSGGIGISAFGGTLMKLDAAKQLWCTICVPQLREVLKARINRGNYEGALSTAKKLVAACPDDPADWLCLADLLAKQGNQQMAQSCIAEAKRRTLS